MNMLFMAEEAQWVFDLGAYGLVWNLLIEIGIILLFLLFGNILRNVVPFLKKSLIPSALIGGLLLLVVKIILNQLEVNVVDWTWNFAWYEKKGVAPSVATITFVDDNLLQVITYHGLAIGFIASTFRTPKVKNKVGKVKMFENGVMTGATYMLQAFVGLLITIIWFLITRDKTNPTFFASGVILPLGFGQGPGNALTWDKTFSTLLFDVNTLSSVDVGGKSLFAGNGSYGLTLASVGFIVASLFGVLHINIAKSKGNIQIREAKKNSDICFEDYMGENEIPESESIDKFSVQIAFVAIAYIISFIIMVLLSIPSKFTNGIAWGFNFIWGVIAATLIKLILKGLKKAKIVKRDYINNNQMDRISGFAFDLMIVAGVAAIKISDVQNYIWELIVLSVVGTLITYFYVKFVCEHCFKGYEHEMFVTNFGTLTGTASNGMILLKEIDPNLETPASNLFILSQFPAMICVAPLLLLLSMTGNSFKGACIACGIFFVLFIGYSIFLFRKAIFKKKA